MPYYRKRSVIVIVCSVANNVNNRSRRHVCQLKLNKVKKKKKADLDNFIDTWCFLGQI